MVIPYHCKCFLYSLNISYLFLFYLLDGTNFNLLRSAAMYGFQIYNTSLHFETSTSRISNRNMQRQVSSNRYSLPQTMSFANVKNWSKDMVSEETNRNPTPSTVIMNQAWPNTQFGQHSPFRRYYAFYFSLHKVEKARHTNLHVYQDHIFRHYSISVASFLFAKKAGYGFRSLFGYITGIGILVSIYPELIFIISVCIGFVWSSIPLVYILYFFFIYCLYDSVERK